MALIDQLEKEYLEATEKYSRSRKPDRKVFYLGKMAGLHSAMILVVGDRRAEETIGLINYAVKYSRRANVDS